MRIGVYVGSFDPVHKGHMKVVNYLINNHYVEKCIIVPTLGYWDKNNQIDISKRIDMLKTYESENIIIDTKNNDLPYSYLILNSLKTEYPNDELYLIIGNDLISEFDKWKNYEEILKHKVIVIKRIKVNTRDYVNKLNAKGRFVILDNFRNMHVSSTMVRDNFYNETKENLLKAIDEKVYNYIIENNLYKGGK